MLYNRLDHECRVNQEQVDIEPYWTIKYEDVRVQDGAPQRCERWFINREITPSNQSYIYHL